MSNGGILKSGWVVVNPANTRIIDSNARAEAKLKELAIELARQCGEEPDFAEGFTQGISAVEVSELIHDDGETSSGQNRTLIMGCRGRKIRHQNRLRQCGKS